MKNLSLVVTLIALFGMLAPQVSLAAVEVGDTPSLSFKPAAGTGSGEVSLESLKGKVVVIDFWATWCGPCMAEAEHMVAINKKYSEQGLQMIGISLDENQGDLQRIIKEKSFDWPQHFDGKGWKNKFAADFGVKGIPKTFIIDPDGKVAWSGHPARIDEPLEKVFKEHPPVLVDPKIVADASKQLDQVDAALGTSDTAGAMKLLAKIPPEARKDAAFAKRQGEIEKKLGDSADKMLAEVDALIQEKNFGEASTRLQTLTRTLGTLPAATKAKEKLTALNANPEAKATMAGAEKNAKAAEELAIAQQLQADKKDDSAYPRFKGIVKQFPGTDAAASAEAAVKTYEADASFMKHYNDTAVAGKAKASLSMAESYKKSGRKDLAKKKYQSVIEEFPGTSYADAAQKEIDGLK